MNSKIKKIFAVSLFVGCLFGNVVAMEQSEITTSERDAKRERSTRRKICSIRTYNSQTGFLIYLLLSNYASCAKFTRNNKNLGPNYSRLSFDNIDILDSGMHIDVKSVLNGINSPHSSRATVIKQNIFNKFLLDQLSNSFQVKFEYENSDKSSKHGEYGFLRRITSATLNNDHTYLRDDIERVGGKVSDYLFKKIKEEIKNEFIVTREELNLLFNENQNTADNLPTDTSTHQANNPDETNNINILNPCDNVNCQYCTTIYLPLNDSNAVVTPGCNTASSEVRNFTNQATQIVIISNSPQQVLVLNQSNQLQQPIANFVPNQTGNSNIGDNR